MRSGWAHAENQPGHEVSAPVKWVAVSNKLPRGSTAQTGRLFMRSPRLGRTRQGKEVYEVIVTVPTARLRAIRAKGP